MSPGEERPRTEPAEARSRQRKFRVALLYGGRSAEHAVSVVSARSVLEALDPRAFEVVPIGITRHGQWLLPATSPLELQAPPGGLPEVEERGSVVELSPAAQNATLRLGDAPVDIVFPLLHGPFGEDGTVQGLLELAGVPYVGAGVLASALAMDKAMAKVVLAQAGLPQAPYLVVADSRWRQAAPEVTAAIGAGLGYPVFTKPARLGSSIGITKVHDASELADGMEEALAHDRKVVVERGIQARELECGVIGNEDPQASTVGEIVPSNEFYDFEAKYLDESKLIIPAPVPNPVREAVRELALRAYRALECAGYARVDFFYTEADGALLVNEINTIPGFTPRSMFPMLWEASGLPYPELVARLIELGLQRRR